MPSFPRFLCPFSLWWLTIHRAKTEHKRVGWRTQQNLSSHSSGGWKSGDSVVGFLGGLSSWLVESQPQAVAMSSNGLFSVLGEIQREVKRLLFGIPSHKNTNLLGMKSHLYDTISP